MRGPFIGEAYVEGMGLVRVFTDLDDTRRLFVLAVKSDKERSLPRRHVHFRKMRVAN